MAAQNCRTWWHTLFRGAHIWDSEARNNIIEAVANATRPRDWEWAVIPDLVGSFPSVPRKRRALTDRHVVSSANA